MNDLLQTGNAWLQAQRHSHLAHAVTYRRAGQSLPLQATVGETTFDVETAHGAETWESRDFLIRVADLVLEAAATPARGDRIAELVGAKTLVFEVMAPGDAPCWQYSDPGRLTFRVHTKLVDTETV